MVLVGTLFIQTMMSVLVFAPLVLAPSIIATIGGSPGLAGLYAPLAFGCGIIGSLSSAPLVSRFGPWRVSVCCLLVGAVGAAIFGLGTPLSLAVGAMVIGLGYGPVTAAGSSLLLAEPSAHLGLKMSIRQSGVPLGSTAAGIIAPMLNLTIGWAHTLWAFGALAALSAVGFYVFWDVVRRERSPGTSGLAPKLVRPMELAYREQGFRALVLMALVFSSLQNCFVSFLSVYLVEHVRLTITTAGLFLGISHTLGIVARLAWGVAADRFRPALIIGLLGFLMAIASIAAGLLQPGMPLALVLSAVVGLGASVTGWNGVILAQATRAVPSQFSTQAVAEMVVFTYIGFIVGPPVFATISTAAAMPWAFITTGALCAIATTIFLAKASTGTRAVTR